MSKRQQILFNLEAACWLSAVLLIPVFVVWIFSHPEWAM